MINFKYVNDLPTLAWLAQIDGTKLTCFAGNKVNFKESNQLVYSGTVSYFTKDGLNGNMLNLSNIYLGSGIMENNDGVVVFTPSHFTEHCYFYKNKLNGEIFVSNSLYFICAKTNLSINEIMKFPFKSLFCGIFDYDVKLFENDEYEFYAASCYQVYIKNGQIKFIPQVFQERFYTFEEYHNYIKKIIRSAYINANAERCIVYLSKGYDSVCCASLAYQIPEITNKIAVCRRVDRHGHDDDGTEIAKKLNMKVIELKEPEREFEIKTYKNTTKQYKSVKLGDSEDEMKRISLFAVPWSMPLDESLYSDDVDFSDSIVLVGEHGDTLYDYRKQDNDNFNRKDAVGLETSGTTYTEFALQKGFIAIPVPSIPTVLHSDLKKISKSKEMEKYKLNNWYDRPIPRRIAEEYAHIKRGAFANEKSAIVTMVDSYSNEKNMKFMNYRLEFYKNIIK